MDFLYDLCADAHSVRLVKMLIYIAVWLAISSVFASATNERGFLAYREHKMLQILNRVLFVAGCVTCLFVKLRISVWSPIDWIIGIILTFCIYCMIFVLVLLTLNMIKRTICWTFNI